MPITGMGQLKNKSVVECCLPYHVIGLTKDQFFATGGSTCDLIMKALGAAPHRTMHLAALNPANYPARTVMEVRTMASF